MNEDELLKKLSKFWGNQKELIVPNGDDTLALKANDSEAILITVDTSLENVHFTTTLLSFDEIGYRAVAGALSDIAAMGGIPITILIDLEVPEPDLRKVENIYNGIRNLQQSFDFSIGGGNIVHGDRWRITTTVVGKVEIEYILTRNKFEPGDNIYITGDIGRVQFFLEKYNEKSIEPHLLKILRKKFSNPIPRIKEMRELKQIYKINGAIDISDGIGIDLTRVAKASSVDIFIDLERIPYKKELEAFKSDYDFYLKLVSSGEEYEVCFSSPQEIIFQNVTKLGYVKEGKGRVFGILGEKTLNISSLGYDHLKTSNQ